MTSLYKLNSLNAKLLMVGGYKWKIRQPVVDVVVLLFTLKTMEEEMLFCTNCEDTNMSLSLVKTKKRVFKKPHTCSNSNSNSNCLFKITGLRPIIYIQIIIYIERGGNLT